MLMAVLMCGLATTVVSCSDDDNDNKSEQRNEDADPLDTDEANVAWRWLSALTSAQTLPDDWAKKSYEPTVGVASMLDGIKQSQRLRKSQCNANHRHPAFEYLPKDSEVLLSKGFSNWFIPSTGQWILAMQGFGLTWDGKSKDMYFGPQGINHYNLVQTFFKKIEAEDCQPMGFYWTATQTGDYSDEAYAFAFYDDAAFRFDKFERCDKDDIFARAFIAF